MRDRFFNGPSHVVVYFTFDLTPKAAGQRPSLEEVGV
jgi:hypothetical protein